MHVKNINFMDNVSTGPMGESSSIIQNLIFRYKYRQAFDSVDTYNEKEANRVKVMQQNLPSVFKKLESYLGA